MQLPAASDSFGPASAQDRMSGSELSRSAATAARENDVRGREAQKQGTRRRSGRIVAGPPAVPEDRFPGLKLGPLLGQGSYGSVFRGTYQGHAVAVKVREVCCPVTACSGLLCYQILATLWCHLPRFQSVNRCSGEGEIRTHVRGCHCKSLGSFEQ